MVRAALEACRPQGGVSVGIVRILGFILVVGGTVFGVNAYNASKSPLDQASKFITGRATDRTERDMMIGGGIIAGGVLLIAVGGGGGRRRR